MLEGFNSGWGNHIGLIWNNDVAYSYSKLSSDNYKLNIEKISLKKDNFYNKILIDRHIFDRLNAWDTTYIANQKKQIGMNVLDGYNYISTKVINKSGQKLLIETIAFEQFINDKKAITGKKLPISVFLIRDNSGK